MKCPCKGCPKRTLTCHSVCTPYEDWKIERAAKMLAEDEVSTSAHSDEYRTTAIRKDGVGEFYYDQKRGTIDWANEYGDEVSMKPEYWEKLADEIPKMLRILNGEI